MKIINPSTEKLVGEYAPDTPAEIEGKLSSSAAAFASWRRMKIEDRCAKIRALGVVLRSRRSDLAMLMAQEMGKPLGAGETEVSKSATACDHFAQSAVKMLEPVALATGGGRGYSRFDPLGPILAIMPWNFPVWQVIRFGVAALAAGNVIVLKHAPIVPGCAMAIEAACREAGLGEGVFVSVRIDDNAEAEKLCGDSRIAAITATASERAGAAVAAMAGAKLKKTVLELGGSDPFIVLKDADVDFAATSAAESRCGNSGQSCIAAKRFIVEAPIHARFVEALTAAMARQKLGDPMNPNTTMGPLARLDLLEKIQHQVEDSIQAGARLIAGGKRVGTVGYFYPATILCDVRPGMAVFDEETFGPVAAVTSAADVNEAIELANQTSFGLGASIWSRDLTAAEKLCERIDAGNVFINSIVRSDPRLPFGGIKNSGWGRELGEAGLKEFVNVKTIWVSKA